MVGRDAEACGEDRGYPQGARNATLSCAIELLRSTKPQTLLLGHGVRLMAGGEAPKPQTPNPKPYLIFGSIAKTAISSTAEAAYGRTGGS